MAAEKSAEEGSHGDPSETRPKRRVWAKRLLLSAASLLLALGVLEWVLRVAWPVGGCVLGLHDRYLFAPIPDTQHIQFMSRNPLGRHIIVEVNSHGMLGPEPDPDRKRPRWMVFGDSFVFSENEPYPYTFSARLQHAWQDQVEVLCAGVTGYGPDQNLLRMQEFVPRYAPDGVIYVVCAYNDFGDPVRNHLFTLDEQGELVAQTVTPAEDEAAWFRRRLRESQMPGLQRLWINFWRVRAWPPPQRPDATQIADYLRAHREDYEAHKRRETVAYGMLRDVYDADVALRPQWPSSQYKERLYAALLQRIADQHREWNIPLVVVVVPGGVDLDPDSWLRVDPQRYPTYDPARLNRVASEGARQAGVPTLDLYPPFAEVADEIDLFEGPIDPHWNRQGMDLGAKLTAEFLREIGLSPVE